MSRVHRACILLEIINDETGDVYAQGIEINGPGAEADVAFDERFTLDSYSGAVVNRSGFYGVAVRGKGRMFYIDLGGQWPSDPTPQQRSIGGT